VWAGLLGRAQDLGPSHAPSANVLVALRSAHRPAALLRWSAARGVRATWFTGQPTAMLTAAPAALGGALGVRIDDFRLRGYPVFYAVKRDPRIPLPLKTQVAAFGRITSFGRLHADIGPGPGALQGRIPVGGVGPGGFVTAYGVRPLWSRQIFGQGQTIVLFEVDGFSPADLAAYAARFGLPPFASPLPSIGPTNGKIEGESDTDLEVAHAIAPDAKLVYVNLGAFGGRNASIASQFQRAFSSIARQFPGAIWNISLGQCEDIIAPADARAVNNAVSTAERAGTSVFVSSGDSGGLDCLGVSQQDPRIPAKGISFPGDLPQVTSVGGTSLQLTTAGQYLGETAWTEPLLSQGSTGGPSVLFTHPAWQSAPGVANRLYNGSRCGNPSGLCRQVPDVSADASPASGAAVLINGKWVANGGTSVATPVWAAMTALMDQYLRAVGRGPVGFANPRLYQIARGPAYSHALHDVTIGNNDFYPAGPGYDMVTGLGSPDTWNLVRDLAASAPASKSPAPRKPPASGRRSGSP
jgi:kumamolisin